MMLTAFGVTDGIGSMLIGAQQAGFKVLGNVEWRQYYHSGTWEANFPDAMPLTKDYRLIQDFRYPTIVFSHPECGAYSNLRSVKNTDMENTPGDIPLAAQSIRTMAPDYFCVDNLAPSLKAFPILKWVEMLPDYDIFPEWISNYGYGNVQKHRNRLFIIGAKKYKGFVFRPGEFKHDKAIYTILNDIFREWGTLPNHTEHNITKDCPYGIHMHQHGQRATWTDMMQWMAKVRSGTAFQYYGPAGDLKTRMGLYKGYWYKHSHVLTGTNPLIHPLTCLPMSIRERARIQGTPDNFVFVGEVIEDDGTFLHNRNMTLVKQTGKFMPVEACRYVSQVIADHEAGTSRANVTKTRIVSSPPIVDNEKMSYCNQIGYTNQDGACKNCWIKDCPVRVAKSEVRSK